MPKHVKTGDTVIINTGDYKGRTGVVLKVIPKNNKVIVQGINTKTKHLKPSKVSPQGGVITKEMPIHISNVNPVIDGNKLTRVRFPMDKDGNKIRQAARDNSELSVVRKNKDKSKSKKKK